MHHQERAHLEARIDTNMALDRGLSPAEADKHYTESVAFHLAWIFRQQRRKAQRNTNAA